MEVLEEVMNPDRRVNLRDGGPILIGVTTVEHID